MPQSSFPAASPEAAWGASSGGARGNSGATDSPSRRAGNGIVGYVVQGSVAGGGAVSRWAGQELLCEWTESGRASMGSASASQQAERGTGSPTVKGHWLTHGQSNQWRIGAHGTSNRRDFYLGKQRFLWRVSPNWNTPYPRSPFPGTDGNGHATHRGHLCRSCGEAAGGVNETHWGIRMALSGELLTLCGVMGEVKVDNDAEVTCQECLDQLNRLKELAE
jgi:hypothetical protein